MGDGAQLSLQQWLPGFEPRPNGALAPRRPPRRPGGRPQPRPPSIDKLAEKASARVQRYFSSLRGDLLREKGIAEGVHYDESAASFTPSYSYRQRELVRIHLDPVLAATVTLDPGERQLASLLRSEAVPEKLKAQLAKSARRSGRRLFLAVLVRNGEDLASLLHLLKERIALET